MDYINEKVSYLKGLCDGLDINEETKEGKVLVKIVDVLEDITDALDGLNEAYEDLEDYVEMVDEDLMDVEDELYELELDEDDYEDDDFEEDIYEIECPNCGNEFITSFDDMDDEDFQIECPSCGYIVDLYDLMCDCEDDNCDCGLEPLNPEDEEL
ncbi:MAG TPA: transcriptional regulator [Eubacteriaceae bacterium]|nr:transcriptional regulator [Eubacteriaceae bacterium]